MENISVKKFHRIYGGLKVALEATLKPGEKLECDSVFLDDCPDLKFEKGLVMRAYHPARIYGGLNGPGNDELRISFLSWVENESQFCRLVFWADNLVARENIAFARENEKKPFGFRPGKGGSFINLDFFGKRSDEFLPLFAMVDGYLLKIEAEISEDEVALIIRKVLPVDVPVHLQEIYGQ